MSIGEALQQLWDGILHVMSLLVIPDWGSLIALLPVFLVLGLIGPLLSLGLLVWLIYFVRAPRAPLPQEPGPTAAPRRPDGAPIVPRGEVYCFRDSLIYPPGARRCEVCGDELAVQCPKCEVVRSATIDTCGNCGLVLKVVPKALVARRAGPPPGGAAIA